LTTRLKKFLLVTTAIVAVAVVAPSAADAMPPIIGAIVAVAGVIGTAGSIAAVGFFGTTLTGFGAVFAHFAIRAALGYALQSLSKTGQRGTAGKGYSATVNSVGPSLPHQVIYGETRTGGAVFYQTTSGASNLYLHKCIAFAGHEINSYVAWYLNDELVTLDGSGLVTNGTFANKVRVATLEQLHKPPTLRWFQKSPNGRLPTKRRGWLMPTFGLRAMPLCLKTARLLFRL
jgi:hypothetical protein